MVTGSLAVCFAVLGYGAYQTYCPNRDPVVLLSLGLTVPLTIGMAIFILHLTSQVERAGGESLGKSWAAVSLDFYRTNMKGFPY